MMTEVYETAPWPQRQQEQPSDQANPNNGRVQADRQRCSLVPRARLLVMLFGATTVDFEKALPGGRMIHHQIGIIIEQVTASINEKTDDDVRKARETATDVQRLAETLERAMLSSSDPDQLSGPQAAKQLRVLMQMERDLPEIRSYIDRVFDEHGELLPASAKSNIDRFYVWIPARVAKVRERARTFEASMSRDLTEDRAALKQLAEDWSAVDSDGLELR